MAPPDRERRRTQLRWSSKTTWIGALAIVLALGIAALTSVASQQAIRDMEDDLTARIASYGALLPQRLVPAIALRDGGRARDALRTVVADADVVAVTLRGSRGAELYRYGTPGPWQPEDITTTQVLESDDRISTVVPIAMTDGPGGLLTLELSTARIRAYRRIAVWTVFAAGTAALVFGVLARRVLARSVVQRLRAIVEVEVEAAAADSDGEPHSTEDPDDEIAIFGGAFHQMLSRLRHDQRRLRDTVAELTAVQGELARINHELEQRVALRTGELSDANRQLHTEMTQRSHMEVELRQAQKLESVGRLASGIAHEINTPVQFVSDSCSFLETATEDVIAVIAAYRAALADIERGALPVAAGAARVAALATERDLGYLLEQIPLAIRRALQGLQRVSAIVHAMKEFAYPDHKEQAPADLNRAILSTLTVARNEYKYVAEARTELDELPQVTCHIGELNQVVLNMVINSAHAIASAKAEQERDGWIAIRTRVAGDHVVIEIEDNGCGIPAAAFDKIFDPFFTTKEIGKGTGQGLAIARTVVVDKHAGKIDVASQVGHGTTFTITLPIHGRNGAGGTAAPGQSNANWDDSSDRGLEPPAGQDRESA